MTRKHVDGQATTLGRHSYSRHWRRREQACSAQGGQVAFGHQQLVSPSLRPYLGKSAELAKGCRG